MDEARAWLEDLRSLMERDPKGAMRQVERKSAAFREAFRLEGPLHEEFRATVTELRRSINPGRMQPAGVSVSVLSWDALSDLKSLMTAAGHTQAEILYLGEADRRRDAPPLAQIDAVAEFADPKVVVVVVGGGPPLLIRRSFLLSASASLNARTDIADVGQDLVDYAERSGLAARWLR